MQRYLFIFIGTSDCAKNKDLPNTLPADALPLPPTRPDHRGAAG
ncbi:hypothetical protein HMPREF0645_1304 [Hallella bergensis DSM 17361]|uniref:Uncharacterized protein n=1 Tax=Hallella bergensis DSM 17361 TaxID=585502 RepID=D1PWG9_9BACT|nr:hypothetical protein HMPREF0645_1304 [Hallella bergensis DSM 17361]